MVSKRHKTTNIQEALERRVLHGLAWEWKTALWVLGPSHKRRMRAPLFSLRDMTRRLGSWSRERREICLSRILVLNHPWDAVREVLLHEMAHQFAEEVLGACKEPPHGPKFRKACHLLRANPRASGTYRPLDERLSHALQSPEDKIMVRVKKLMALAESKNQHEAELAMAKAHELIGKYNLELLAHSEDRQFTSVFVGKPALRRFREDYHLARLLQDFYFVYGLWVPAYVLEKGKMGRVLEISGTLQNTRIAGYVHDVVQYYVDCQWDTYNEGKGLNRYRKTDFAVGIIEGFRSKLEGQVKKKRAVIEERGLITLEDPLLLAYAAYRYPHTTSFKRGASSQDDLILRDGMEVGRGLVISKGITEKARNKRLFLDKP
ncbi:MAG: DUF2786 domain-containing protein [Thermodesulfobacteriota bacterium]|nr:DUF2786 domain-containing protein [Thermodesulfobacteriota bacterium]